MDMIGMWGYSMINKINEDVAEMSDEKNAGELAIKITEVLMYNFELSKYAPDALIRVLVYFAKRHGWDVEKISQEALVGIKYYYENEAEK